MTHLNPKKTGIALGLIFGGIHLIWSIIVALGWGQAWVDFVLWAHMVHVTYVVGPYDFAASITVIVISAFIGFVLGMVFAKVWNKVHKS